MIELYNLFVIWILEQLTFNCWPNVLQTELCLNSCTNFQAKFWMTLFPQVASGWEHSKTKVFAHTALSQVLLSSRALAPHGLSLLLESSSNNQKHKAENAFLSLRLLYVVVILPSVVWYSTVDQTDDHIHWMPLYRWIQLWAS